MIDIVTEEFLTDKETGVSLTDIVTCVFYHAKATVISLIDKVIMLVISPILPKPNEPTFILSTNIS